MWGLLLPLRYRLHPHRRTPPRQSGRLHLGRPLTRCLGHLTLLHQSVRHQKSCDVSSRVLRGHLRQSRSRHLELPNLGLFTIASATQLL